MEFNFASNQWTVWSGHLGALICDCGPFLGEWPPYAPLAVPADAGRIELLVCLPPPDGSLANLLNGSYYTPYAWPRTNRYPDGSLLPTGDYLIGWSGGPAGSASDPPPEGLHLYVIWYDTTASATPAAPSTTPLAVVPQGMATGSSAPARGGRLAANGAHWSDWYSTIDRSYVVSPDNNETNASTTGNMYYKRSSETGSGVVGEDNYADYSWEHTYLEDATAALQVLTTGPTISPPQVESTTLSSGSGGGQVVYGMTQRVTRDVYTANTTNPSVAKQTYQHVINVSSAAVGYHGSTFSHSLTDEVAGLTYGLDYIEHPDASGIDPATIAGNTYYEAATSEFLGWEAHTVEVLSTSLDVWLDQAGFHATTTPPQSLAVKVAKLPYQLLTGVAPYKPGWHSYADGETIYTIDLGYPADPTAGDGAFERQPITLNFGDDEDLVIQLQFSTFDGPDLMPTPDELDFPPMPPAGTVTHWQFDNTRAVAVDGMPLNFSEIDRLTASGIPDVATGPTPLPRIKYRLPRHRHWVPGPVPAYIPLGDLKIQGSERPPMFFRGLWQ